MFLLYKGFSAWRWAREKGAGASTLQSHVLARRRPSCSARPGGSSTRQIGVRNYPSRTAAGPYNHAITSPVPPDALTSRRRIDGVVEAILVIAMISVPKKW